MRAGNYARGSFRLALLLGGRTRAHWRKWESAAKFWPRPGITDSRGRSWTVPNKDDELLGSRGWVGADCSKLAGGSRMLAGCFDCGKFLGVDFGSGNSRTWEVGTQFKGEQLVLRAVGASCGKSEFFCCWLSSECFVEGGTQNRAVLARRTLFIQNSK